MSSFKLKRSRLVSILLVAVLLSVQILVLLPVTAYAEGDQSGAGAVSDSAPNGNDAGAANDPANTAGGSGDQPTNPLGDYSFIIIMVLMFAVLYFLMIRPQRKKDKAKKAMLSALKVSDLVTTIGGIHGTVTSIKDDTVTIVTSAQKTTLVMARWAIGTVNEAPIETEGEGLI